MSRRYLEVSALVLLWLFGLGLAVVFADTPTPTATPTGTPEPSPEGFLICMGDGSTTPVCWAHEGNEWPCTGRYWVHPPSGVRFEWIVPPDTSGYVMELTGTWETTQTAFANTQVCPGGDFDVSRDWGFAHVSEMLTSWDGAVCRAPWPDAGDYSGSWTVIITGTGEALDLGHNRLEAYPGMVSEAWDAASTNHAEICVTGYDGSWAPGTPTPTPFASPTARPTPGVTPSPTAVGDPWDITQPTDTPCYTLIPGFEYSATPLGWTIDIDFPGFAVCLAPFGMSLELFGIDWVMLVLAVFGVGLAALIYSRL